MLASRSTKPITIDDVTVTIQKVNAKTLEKAEDAARPRNERAALDAKQMFEGLTAETIQAIAGRAKELGSEASIQTAQRYRRYDRWVILKGFVDPDGVRHAGGIKAWTLQDAPLPGAIDDLEDGPANRLHREILDLTLGPVDSGEAETGRKNG